MHIKLIVTAHTIVATDKDGIPLTAVPNYGGGMGPSPGGGWPESLGATLKELGYTNEIRVLNSDCFSLELMQRFEFSLARPRQFGKEYRPS